MTKTRKIAVVGSRLVGKSSITVRFVEDHFVESYYPTIENSFTKAINHRQEEYVLEIMDTAGQEEYSIINENYLVGIHGYLFVYSVTLRQSFELIEIIRDTILNSIGTENIPLVLIGNKCDLESQRQVDTAEGEALASKFRCKFLETSVREHISISNSFTLLLDEIERILNPQMETNSKCIIS